MSTEISAADRSRVYLAVDGGGTKTHALLVSDAGRPLGLGVADGSNYRAIGQRRALAHVQAAVRVAEHESGCAPPYTAAWFGLAGIDRVEDVEMFGALLAPFAETCRVTNDADLALAGVHAGPGVALIAGTGSIALGMDRAGRVVRVGGWGHLIGDEGSGYDIGQRALQVALRMADGRSSRGALLDRVLAYFGAAGHDELIDHVYAGEGKSAVAALAQAVLQAAREGDPDAVAIARAAATELARTAATAARMISGEDDTLALALSGSLLVADEWYRREVVRRIRRRVRVGAERVIAEPVEAAAQALARGGMLGRVTMCPADGRHLSTSSHNA